MEPTIARRLIVAEDLASAAVRLFLDIRPRTVCLAGGNTPREFYARLALCEYDWHNVDVFFSDEGCVPPEDSDSNFGMAWAALLSKVQATVHRIKGEDCDPVAYEQEINGFFQGGATPLDFALLGLGEDGHTASLFPGHPALYVTDRNVAAVTQSDHHRSLSPCPSSLQRRLCSFSSREPRKLLH